MSLHISSMQITLDRKFEAVDCVTCFRAVKLRPLTLQQNINENLTYQTKRNHLMKVTLKSPQNSYVRQGAFVLHSKHGEGEVSS